MADDEFGFGDMEEATVSASPENNTTTTSAPVTMQHETMSSKDAARMSQSELLDHSFDDDEDDVKKLAKEPSSPTTTKGSASLPPPPTVPFVAASLNKHCQAVSQPFVAGADLTSEKQRNNLRGLFLTSVTFNVAMSAPGSFSLSIYTEANAGGKLLAIEKGIEAPAGGFSQVTITFAAPPELEATKLYHFLITLERGAFKFQATPAVDSGLQVNAFATQIKDWSPVPLTFVFRSQYSKPLPHRGQISGILMVKMGQRGGGKATMNRRLSIKGIPVKKRFVVLEQDNKIGIYKGVDASMVSVIDPKTILGVDFVDAFDTVVFNIVTEDKIYQMTAPTAVECKRWTTKLRQILVFTQKDFGHAGNTSFMF